MKKVGVILLLLITSFAYAQKDSTLYKKYSSDMKAYQQQLLQTDKNVETSSVNLSSNRGILQYLVGEFNTQNQMLAQKQTADSTLFKKYQLEYNKLQPIVLAQEKEHAILSETSGMLKGVIQYLQAQIDYIIQLWKQEESKKNIKQPVTK